ncbi:MAG TPA: glycosyltransferase family 87 protein [Methylomirabilota bacterium]|nr:glycosyltransferase family 87 protein [Methylomirabilota bacterium]
MTASRRPVGMAVAAAVVAGTLGWIGVVAIGLQLGAAKPSNLGFDLELLLQAGRASVGGRSPYATELVSGTAPTATHLFYSYPPPVAQAMAVFSWLPSVAALVSWSVVAVTGLLAVAEGLRRRYAPGRSRLEVLAVTAAIAPLALPFAVGLLFGNYDVLFPMLYGAMLLAAIAPTRTSTLAGGAALVVASLKIHPASMGLWFLVRAFRERRAERAGEPSNGSARVVVVAGVIGLAVVALSVVLGGTAAWGDYARVIGAGTRAVVVDPRNAGIAALVAGSIGADDGVARAVHLAVGLVALVVTVWAAWRRGDTVESFAWATAASLVTLPVTWYHYPSAMIPVAIAAALRARGTGVVPVRGLLIAAGVVAAVAIAFLPLVYLALGLVIAAARRSGQGAADVITPERSPGPQPVSGPAPASDARVAG